MAAKMFEDIHNKDDDFKTSFEEYREEEFDCSLAARNLALEKVGIMAPKFIKTGTTIVAATFKNGVVMGADSRATSGALISDKNCNKILKLTDLIYACGAGTAADLDQVCRMLRAHCELYELDNAPRKAPISMAIAHAKHHLFKYQGYIGAYLIIGGVDSNGPKLCQVSANGHSQPAPYLADGSGSLAAISIFEKDYQFDMNEEQCIALVSRAVEAGMHADNMSGNSFRLFISRTDFTSTSITPKVPAFAARPEPNDLEYKFPPGATKVLKTNKIAYEVIEKQKIVHDDAMEVDK